MAITVNRLIVPLVIMSSTSLTHKFLGDNLAQHSTQDWEWGPYGFVWPYGLGGECKCHVNGWGDYGKKSECENQMATSQHEACFSDDGDGLLSGQCSYAVSTQVGVSNDDCGSLCRRAWANKGKDYWLMMKYCKFEFTEVVNDAITLDYDSCFDHYEFGYAQAFADSSGHGIASFALRSESPVWSAQSCQQKCQEENDCVRFLWNGMSGDKFFGNPNREMPQYTCTLFASDAVRAAIATGSGPENIRSDIKDDDSRWVSCDLKTAMNCPIDAPAFGFFQRSPCLFCGCSPVCSWKNKHAVGGPKYCLANENGHYHNDPCKVPEFPEPRTTTTTTAATTGEASTTTSSTSPISSTTTFALSDYSSSTLWLSTTSPEWSTSSFGVSSTATTAATHRTVPSTTRPATLPPCPDCECRHCHPCECDCFDEDNCHCHSSEYCEAAKRRRLHEIKYRSELD